MNETTAKRLADTRALLKSPSPVTWLFTGDSITQGAVHTRGWRDYTQLFKERLGELGRNEDVVINTAVGGWTLGALAGRFDERITRFNPQAVFFMFGTNDAAGAAKGLETFADLYRAIMRQAISQKLLSVVQTTVPVAPVDVERFTELRYSDPAERPGKQARLRSRVEFIERFADATIQVGAEMEIPVIDHWSVWMKHAESIGQLCDGGFHPNEYGHRLLARELFRSLGILDESSWTCRLFLPVNG